MYNIGIIGATGYAGVELVRLLLNHPEANINHIVSKTYAGQKISNIYPNLKGILDDKCQKLDTDEIAKKCELVFTALPHGVSNTIIPELINKNLKVVDLSGDYRYNDLKTYEDWYHTTHTNPELLKESVYGLPELHREKIKKTRLVGNPGCYTTCSILGAAPLLKNDVVKHTNIIIDAKSGVSGAGRKESLSFTFCECTETIKAYKIANHRHTSEIEQELSLIANNNIMVSFTPHLIPIKRGILSTIYFDLKEEKYSEKDLLELYKDFYKREYFVRIKDLGLLPEIKHVAGSNFVDIGLVLDKRLNRVIVVSAVDNLIKGAAGQAIQNMNIMLGINETTGIDNPGYYL